MANLGRRADGNPIAYTFQSPTEKRGFANNTSNIELRNHANAPEEHVKNQRQNENTNVKEASIKFNPGYRFYLAFTALAVLAMMVSLDGTAVSVALPIIATDLNGTTIEAFWSGTGFLLSSSVFQIPLGALSNIFGRIPVLTFCVSCFLVGIVISAISSNFTIMLVGRVIQGVGGGGIILMNDILITDLVPLRARGIYFGIIAGVWALGSISGPVIGGVLAYKVSWRWIFFINIPFAVISLVMVPLTIRLKLVPGLIAEKLRRIDWIGNFIFISSATSFLMPLSWGGILYPWDSFFTLLPLILGLAGFAFFVLYEKYIPLQPIIRLDLLANYNMAYSLFAALINALVVYGSLYFLPLYYEAVKEYNPILSAVALLPATFTVAPTAVISGIITTKTGDFRVLTCLGWIITTLGMGIVCLLDVQTSILQWVFLTLCPGIGLGILYTSLVFVNQSAADDEGQSFAVSMFISARLLGQCLGVALCGVIFQNQLGTRLLAIPELADKAYEYSRDASSLVLTIIDMEEGLKKVELVQAYADSLRIVWAVMCVLSGIALLGSFAVRRVSLDRKLNTKQGLQQEKR